MALTELLEKMRILQLDVTELFWTKVISLFHIRPAKLNDFAVVEVHMRYAKRILLDYQTRNYAGQTTR
ncbi:unnamed protein product [Dibothriocephalus latus]|uniref:Uncharacterized protein n=1 Tax=Dibothriocephalus latus TaxID=60516 RepID=A0A3P7LZG2_DIBLA|nr:unnamed protein product [Dibothriocephalus latus]